MKDETFAELEKRLLEDAAQRAFDEWLTRNLAEMKASARRLGILPEKPDDT